MVPDKYCSGCGICGGICPVKCIDMRENLDGFLEAYVVQDKCIKCGLCRQICTFTTNLSNSEQPKLAFYYACRDEQGRYASSSGGLCFDLGKDVIDRHGHVCGVEYDSKFQRAIYSIARDISVLERFRGSKYLQSKSSDAVRSFIKYEGAKMFAGMPCQVNALRNFLRIKQVEKDYLLVDFACHGTPPLTLWRKYLSEWGAPNHDCPQQVFFRSKAYGWKEFCLYIVGAQKHTFSTRSGGDLFYRFFLTNVCLNKPCYEACPFHRMYSGADIRVGDSWGRDAFDDNKGSSLAIVFTEYGKAAIKAIQSSGTIIHASANEVYYGQIIGKLGIPFCRQKVLKHLQGKWSLSSINRWIVGPYWLTVRAKNLIKRIRRSLDVSVMFRR